MSLACLGLSLVTLLSIAAVLKPSPDGFGTHQQLGLPPCLFSGLTGMRCPSCGMTTAWAHVVRGHLLSAVRANTGGVILALTAMLAAPWCLASAARGRYCGRLPGDGTLALAALTVAAVTLIDWAVRVLQTG